MYNNKYFTVFKIVFLITGLTMVQRVATDERPFESPSSEESGLGRSDSPSDDSEPEAALVNNYHFLQNQYVIRL